MTTFVNATQTMAAAQITLAVTMDSQTDNPADAFNAREATSNPPQLVLTP